VAAGNLEVERVVWLALSALGSQDTAVSAASSTFTNGAHWLKKGRFSRLPAGASLTDFFLLQGSFYNSRLWHGLWGYKYEPYIVGNRFMTRWPPLNRLKQL